MGRRRDDPAGVRALQGWGPVSQALGQVDPVGADARCEAPVLPDQQLQAAVSGDLLEAARDSLRVRGAEVAVDDGSTPGQPARDGDRVGRSLRIGEE
jgi:hypothetical protein